MLIWNEQLNRYVLKEGRKVFDDMKLIRMRERGGLSVYFLIYRKCMMREEKMRKKIDDYRRRKINGE